MSIRSSDTPNLGYDPDAVYCGFAHLGVGAFHRAHQASFADDLLKRGHHNCGIVGVNLTTPDLTIPHRAQGGIYRILQRDSEQLEARSIAAIREFFYAPEHLRTTVQRLSDERIHFITLTITEKGYCTRSGFGELDLSHSGILHDIEHPEGPVTAPGLILAVLRERHRRGAPPVTLASCDNVPGNGNLLKGTVRSLARAQRPDSEHALLESASFPGSMVDRIVPAMADEDRAALPTLHGATDRLGVATEPFRQWVLEDDFAGDRPPLELAGVTMVENAAPFEKAKFRLVNATQSALAHLGYLSGFSFIYQAASEERLATFAKALMLAQAETLGEARSVAPQNYIETTMARLQNPEIRHTTLQIGSESSLKIPHRILQPAAERIAAGRDITLHALVIAGWISYISRLSSRNAAAPLVDPMAAEFRRATERATGSTRALTDSFLAIDNLFPASLRASPEFREALTERLHMLSTRTPCEILQREPR